MCTRKILLNGTAALFAGLCARMSQLTTPHALGRVTFGGTDVFYMAVPVLGLRIATPTRLQTADCRCLKLDNRRFCHRQIFPPRPRDVTDNSTLFCYVYLHPPSSHYRPEPSSFITRFTTAVMDLAKQPHTLVLFLFTLLVALCCAYEYDEAARPCDDDKCFAEIHSDVPRCWIQDGNQIVDYMSPMDGGRHRIPNACRRSNIFGGDGYLVAYPSTGGLVLLKAPSAVDLQHLKLPNTHDTARSADEDDDLASRMVQLGAQWWPNWDMYFRHSSRIDAGIFYDYHFPSKVDVAFPTTGGAWVANFTQDAPRHQYEDKACQEWLPYVPDLWRVKMRYALTMDDKSEMIKDLGGTFYISVDEVPGLAKTVNEAVGLFEPFKQRLLNMEDDAYRRRFCTSEDKDTDTDKDTANGEHQKPGWGIGSLFRELR